MPPSGPMKALRPRLAITPIIGAAAGPVSFIAGITNSTMKPTLPSQVAARSTWTARIVRNARVGEDMRSIVAALCLLHAGRWQRHQVVREHVVEERPRAALAQAGQPRDSPPRGGMPAHGRHR